MFLSILVHEPFPLPRSQRLVLFWDFIPPISLFNVCMTYMNITFLCVDNSQMFTTFPNFPLELQIPKFHSLTGHLHVDIPALL